MRPTAFLSTPSSASARSGSSSEAVSTSSDTAFSRTNASASSQQSSCVRSPYHRSHGSTRSVTSFRTANKSPSKSSRPSNIHSPRSRPGTPGPWRAPVRLCILSSKDLSSGSALTDLLNPSCCCSPRTVPLARYSSNTSIILSSPSCASSKSSTSPQPCNSISPLPLARGPWTPVATPQRDKRSAWQASLI